MSVEDWEARSILNDLQRRYAGPIHDWDTFTSRLERRLKDHAGRRTINAGMIRDVAQEAYGYVAEQLAAPQAERDDQLVKLEGVVERLEKRLHDQSATIRAQADLLDEKRTIREARSKADDDQVEVTFANGYTGWTVEGLEEIAYRLRLGGAVDDTKVSITDSRATGLVADPTLVQLDMRPPAPRKPEPMRLDPPEYDRKPSLLPGLRVDPLALVMALALVALVCAMTWAAW